MSYSSFILVSQRAEVGSTVINIPLLSEIQDLSNIASLKFIFGDHVIWVT